MWEQQRDDDEGDEGDGELGEGGDVVQGLALPDGEGEPGEQAEEGREQGVEHEGRDGSVVLTARGRRR